MRAQHFWLELMSFYTADELLVGDATRKDRRVMRANVGWGMRGKTPVVRDTILTRGDSVSAFTLFSHKGFESWRYTRANFNARSWQVEAEILRLPASNSHSSCMARALSQRAMDEMLFTRRADGTRLINQFECLLLDNASIHKDPEYLLKLKTRIQVKFLPPYCFEFSPLDNGAYGLVVRFLKAPENADLYGSQPIEVGLDAAFKSVDEDSARWCFHNCRYYF